MISIEKRKYNIFVVFTYSADDYVAVEPRAEETNSEKNCCEDGRDRWDDGGDAVETRAGPDGITETMGTEEEEEEGHRRQRRRSPALIVRPDVCRVVKPAATTAEQQPWTAAAGRERAENDKSREHGDERVGVRYSYNGPPKINVSTWNERPKRQVSIKTDRDYVIGIRQRFQQQQQQHRQNADAVGATNENDNGGFAEPTTTTTTTTAVSRVPIVKSVELKKPYAVQLQLQQTTAIGAGAGAGPTLALSEAIKAQAKLSNGYGLYRGALQRRQPLSTVSNDESTDFWSSLHGNARRPCSTTNSGKNKRCEKILDPRQSLLESIRSFGGRDNLKKIRA